MPSGHSEVASVHSDCRVVRSEIVERAVAADTIVLLTRKTSGGTIGLAITYTVIPATSFTINSDSAIDTSTFSYFLIENP